MRASLNLYDESSFADQTARAAAQLLLDLRLQEENGEITSGSELGRMGSTWADMLIRTRIRAQYPTDLVLTPHTPTDPKRARAKRVWLVDPLNGIGQFSRPGCPDWAVQIALWQRGQGVTAAAVAVPALCAYAHTGQRLPLPVAPGQRPLTQPRLLVDSRDPSSHAGAAACRVDADVLAMGSAGANVLAVVRGEADAYLHTAGQGAWTAAAPLAVAAAAGLVVRRVDGHPVRYDHGEPLLPDLLVCHPYLDDDLSGALLPGELAEAS